MTRDELGLPQAGQIEEAKKKELEPDQKDFVYDMNKEIGIISKNLGGGMIDIKNYTIHQYLTAKNILKDG